MKASSTKSPRNGGRPSRKVAEEIRDEILEAATRLFFEEGYGNVSIEAIAAAAKISKRTFYHRFQDKADIFKAVVKNVIGRLRPPDTKSLFEGANGAEILYRLAPLILHAALTPDAVALHRIVMAEAGRFPELGLMMNAEGSRNEAVQRIAVILEYETKEGRMKVRNPPFAACAVSAYDNVIADAARPRSWIAYHGVRNEHMGERNRRFILARLSDALIATLISGRFPYAPWRD